MTDFLNQTGAAAAYPEMFLACAAMFILMFGVFRKTPTREFSNIFAISFLGLAAILVMIGINQPASAFGGAFVSDSFARLMKLLILFGAAGAIVLSYSYMRAHLAMSFEYPVLVLLSATGMMMMISANDLIALYIGLELQSLALYVLAAFHLNNAKSSEAGLKYFVLGALSSGMLLYGSSLIYGFTGTTAFPEIAKAAGQEAGLGLIFGLVFVIAGLAFKVSAVPFHMWTPDVYEGSPTPVTAFFASAPKVAAMALFTRVMFEAFGGASAQWQQVIIFISIASMGLGAFAAIGQTNIKRLLAYSSIANMGFALVGLAAANEEGARGVILYMAIYMIMTLGAFACVIAMRRDGRQLEQISDFAGLARTDKWLAFIFAALMFSLAGIPPLAGFFAKYFVFMAAVKSGLWLLAVLGVIASVIGAYYYLRVVKLMYFDEPEGTNEPVSPEVRVVAVLTGLFTIAFVVIAKPFLVLAADAARSLFS